MRSNKISPVSDGCRQITNLQWRSQHFTLPDRNRNDGTGTPTFTVIFIIILAIRQKASIFPRQVNAQLITVSHRYQVILPNFKRLSHTRITPTAIDHITQPPTKKGVAGSSQRISHIQRRSMAVAGRFAVPGPCISMCTSIQGFCRNHFLLKESQRLCRLECRSRRITPHDGTIQQRLVRIFRQHDMVLSPLATDQQVWIIRRRRNQTQNLPGFRLDHDNATPLVLHQLLTQSLQIHIDRKRQVLTRHGSHIVAAFFIPPFYTSMRITQQNLHTLNATQSLFVRQFHT